jgi:hypothetical protein
LLHALVLEPPTRGRKPNGFNSNQRNAAATADKPAQCPTHRDAL